MPVTLYWRLVTTMMLLVWIKTDLSSRTKMSEQRSWSITPFHIAIQSIFWAIRRTCGPLKASEDVVSVPREGSLLGFCFCRLSLAHSATHAVWTMPSFACDWHICLSLHQFPTGYLAIPLNSGLPELTFPSKFSLLPFSLSLLNTTILLVSQAWTLGVIFNSSFSLWHAPWLCPHLADSSYAMLVRFILCCGHTAKAVVETLISHHDY